VTLCHLCRVVLQPELGEVAGPDADGDFYCADRAWCLYRARARLGMADRGYWHRVDGDWRRRHGARELLLHDLREGGRRPGVYT
jgi:hypothetical protein